MCNKYQSIIQKNKHLYIIRSVNRVYELQLLLFMNCDLNFIQPYKHTSYCSSIRKYYFYNQPLDILCRFLKLSRSIIFAAKSKI